MSKKSERKFKSRIGQTLSGTPVGNQRTEFSLETGRFMDERFDSSSYIRSTLQNNDEEGVRSFYRTLVQARDLAASDLQQNVFKNYREFVKISKEIEQLETDMVKLNNLLNDLRLLHDQSKPQEQIRTDVKHPLAELYHSVEGVATFLGPFDTSSGRIVVHTGVVSEVDGSSGKEKCTMMFYLLNDVLLAATKRTRGLKIKYAAEKVFGFGNLNVADVRDTSLSPEGTVFKLTERGNAPYFFKVSNSMMKKNWISLIKSQIDEVKTSVSNPKSVQRRMSIFVPTTFSSPASPNPGQFRISSVIDEQIQDLDVFIALQDFQSAIRHVQFLENHPNIGDRVSKLCTALLRGLNADVSNLQYLKWLIDLDQIQVARTAYLTGRSQQIKNAIRKLKFAGDLPIYVAELSRMTCFGVGAASNHFNEAFKGRPYVFAFFSEWAAEHIKSLANAVLRQLGDDPNIQILNPCLEACVPSIIGLKQVGLDLEFVFWDSLSPQVFKAVEKLNDSVSETLYRDFSQIIKEQKFGNLILEFIEKTKFYHAFSMFQPRIIKCIKTLCESFINQIVRVKEIDNQISLVDNSKLLSKVYKQVSDELSITFSRQVTEFPGNLETRTLSALNGSKSVSDESVSEPEEFILLQHYKNLSSNELDSKLEELSPTNQVKTLVTQKNIDLEPILAKIISEPTPTKICVGFVTQMVMDCHYLNTKLTLPPHVKSQIKKVCEKVLRAYISAGGSPKNLQQSQWYEDRITKCN